MIQKQFGRLLTSDQWRPVDTAKNNLQKNSATNSLNSSEIFRSPCEPEPAVCSGCGDPLADHVKVVATDYDGPRCGDCADYRPSNPPPEIPDPTDQQEAELYCSASFACLTALTYSASAGRRLAHGA